MSLSQFQYYEKISGQKKALVLLHGTGGDEHNLLPLVSSFSDEFAILSLRGNIQENGMNRFFKRTSFGMFDEENIREEVKKLQSFVNAWAKAHEIDFKNIIFVGLSNGANMILALAFLHPEIVFRAALLHPMLPLQPQKNLQLSHSHFFVSWSPMDQMVTEEQSQKVLQTLQNGEANITECRTDAGHSLTQQEVTALHVFITDLQNNK